MANLTDALFSLDPPPLPTQGREEELCAAYEAAFEEDKLVWAEIEFLAGDFPAKWLYRIPADFFEIKAFLSTQIMDEARHLEVFRKRALAGGGACCT